jgi:hypothetical protein
VFTHGDLQSAHVFVRGDEVTGVIDWSEAGPGDASYDLASDEEVLAGGNCTAVSRRGEAVHRTAGPWTRTVHRLLEHLHARGVRFLPRPLGHDE